MMNVTGNYTILNNYGLGGIRQAQKHGENTVSRKADQESGLSGKAQALLEKLNKTYGDVEFKTVGKGEDPKAALEDSTKEFTVILTDEELEKMAADEDYEKECMSRIEGAVRMSDQINKEFGMEEAFEGIEITRMGVSFDANGTATYFAELGKSIDARKEQVEKAAEKRAEEKKQTEELTKKVLVTAGSASELAEKIRQVDWSAIEGIEKEKKGRFVDYNI